MPFPFISSMFTSTPSGAQRDDQPAPGQSNAGATSTPFSIPINDRTGPSSAVPEAGGSGDISDVCAMPNLRSERFDAPAADEMLNHGVKASGMLRGLEGVEAAVVEVVDSMGSNSAQYRESDSSIQTLNALLEASYTQGYTDRHIPPSINDKVSKRYTSVLPPAAVDFASRYPLITLASLGGIGATVLLGTGILTARAYRLLRRTESPITIHTQLEIQDSKQRSVIWKLGRVHSDVRSVAETLHRIKQRQVAVETLLRAKGSGAGSRSSLDSAPIAPGIGEARLGQVIREAVEDVLTSSKAAGVQIDGQGGATGGGPGQYSIGEVVKSIDRLESITLGVLDEIKLLRESKAAEQIPPPEGEGVMSMGDIARMIKLVQADSIDTADGAAATVTEASNTKPSRKSRKSKAASETVVVEKQSVASADETGLDQPEMGALGRADSEPDAGGKGDALEVVADDMRNVSKARRKKAAKLTSTTASGTSGDDEPAQSSSVTTSPLDAAAVNQAEQSPDLETPLQQPAPEIHTVPADDVIAAKDEQEGVGSTQQSTPPRSRKPTAIPQSSSLLIYDLPPQPKLGVNGAGDWSFKLLLPSTVEKGWLEADLLLTGRMAHIGMGGSQTWSGSFLTMGSGTRPIHARVFFNPEPDMVELDGGIWRCGRECREYVIRERIV